MRRIKYRKVRKVQPNIFEYTGQHRTDPVEMQLFVYDAEGFEEYPKVSLKRVRHEISDETQANDVKWLNFHGLHDVDLIKEVGEMLDVEGFIISDILNTSRRTRMDELDDVLFFSIKSILQEQDSDVIQVEQISFLIRDKILVSFQEKRSDFFTHIRNRIRTGHGVVRKKGAEYLLYLMLDAVMENFYITIENYEDKIEDMIVESKTDCSPDVLEKIEVYRESLNFMKRSILPLRDALYNLKSKQEDDNYEDSQNATFFARLHQKSLEILDQIEYDMNSLDSASSVYFSSQSQRMNQIMKTLTIFSVIFMPLTFIVGVYGMNFENMPELRTENGYYVVWGIMIVTVILMTIYFKRKKWF
ncbi:MAG TPA: magnesium/cobalt transporter CorA [Flavobacterium sp.]